MNKEEVKQGIKKWLEHWGLSIYTVDEFSVHDGKGRPDMLVVNENYAKKNSVIEMKRAERTLEAEKISEYAIEYQRTADFIRGRWRSWNDREEMWDLNIGVLLSNWNDLKKTLNGIPEPRIFVMHYTRTGRWRPWWTTFFYFFCEGGLV